MISSERASQEEQNGAKFSFIAPSSEDLYMSIVLYISTATSTACGEVTHLLCSQILAPVMIKIGSMAATEK